MADSEEGAKPVIPTKEEALAKAKTAFDLVQKVRINGANRCIPDIAALLGIPPQSLGAERLRVLEQKCKRADISRGKMYADRGLVYICTVSENEFGFQIGYSFVAKISDWNQDEVVR